MLSVIQEKLPLLKKNVQWLEHLLTAKSIELYCSGVDDHVDLTGPSPAQVRAHVVDYYTLIGINGDPEKVMPVPVLLEVLGLSIDELLAGKLIEWLTKSFPTSVSNIWDRRCMVGKHDPSTVESGYCHNCSMDWGYVDTSAPPQADLRSRFQSARGVIIHVHNPRHDWNALVGGIFSIKVPTY